MSSRLSRLRAWLLGASLLPFSLLATGSRAAEADPAWAAFRARHGQAWTLGHDPLTGRPRRLAGGALPALSAAEWSSEPDAADDLLLRRARAFLQGEAALLGLQEGALRPASMPVVRSGRLRVVHFELAPFGVPVEGGRVVVAAMGGRITYVHAVGTEHVTAAPTPTATEQAALAVALEAAGLTMETLARVPQPVLAFAREPGGGHRLAWRVTMIARDGPRRMAARVDARSGSLLSLTDETVSACDPVPPTGAERRVLGAVRPVSADQPERPELLVRALVETQPAGRDGFFVPPGAPYAATLDGPAVRVECVDCATPLSPRADAGSGGDVDFGSGGTDEAGNGAATPSDRASYFHAEAAARLASRWMTVPFVTDPVVVRTNIPSACNAYWDGASLNFFRSSPNCSNTGEIRDVIQHEWGHGLDENDGQPPAGLSVDAATGEAAADLVAMLRSRDSCIGESFHLDPSDFPSRDCSGVRDLDEKAPGHERGNPATLSTTNALGPCSPSAFYRGPLGGEGHCEGEIFGQAAWHLVQSLVSGVSYGDGSPIPGGALPEEEAWQVLENLFFTSRPLLASYAPSTLQSIGVSAHDAFLVADDTGDGVGNGTPHAAAIAEAFGHHGMLEPGASTLDTAPCAAPADPIVTTTAPTDPASGLPTVRVAWSDTGAARYHVLRSDDAGEGFLPIVGPYGPGAGAHVDRGVLPARGYLYRVVAESASGCLSTGRSPASGAAGPLLRVSAVSVDDTGGGNGDIALAEGEVADLRVDVTNDGSAVANGLSVTLSSSDPAVVVTSAGPIAYGTVAAGATVIGPGVFTVRADPGAPRFVTLTATGEALEGCLRGTWTLELAVVDLERVSHSLDDTVGGDGDFSWEPGEPVDLDVTLRNAGLLLADTVDGVLSLRSPVAGVTIVRNTASWGDIAALGTTSTLPPPFALSAAPGLGPRTPVPLRLDVTVAGAPHRSFDIDLTVGGLPQATREWSAAGETTSPTPVVVQLTDDDGDGVITRCDVPDVLVAHWVTGNIGAFSGDDGRRLWQVPSTPCGPTNAFGSIAAGDIDGDGWNEVVMSDLDNNVCAFHADGSFFWMSAVPGHCGPSGCKPQLWDLDRDGDAEVVLGNTTLHGHDGSVLWDNDRWLVGRPLVIDLDLDGELEVIAGSTTWRADGTFRSGGFDSFLSAAAAGNLDDDPFPEVVSLGAGGSSGDLTVFEHDGSVKWTRNDLPGRLGGQGPVCLGDFDGDGHAEIGVATEFLFHVIGEDRTTLWTTPVSDPSGASGCSVFDFDGDGPPEIVYRDEQSVYVFDGVTGETLWRAPASSGTGYEYPFVVDVDGDGLAEIVVTGGIAGQAGQLHAYGHPAWPSARGVWNQEDYSVTHVEEDGSIVTDPFPRWFSVNDFRGQDSVCPCDGPQPDFTVRVDCDQTACFTAVIAGGRVPLEISWDFGDGSPAATGPTPCHPYAVGAGYPVRMMVVDDNGCVAESGQIVWMGLPPEVDVTPDVHCVGSDSCFTADMTWGVQPFDVEWDFGDGSPRASGPSTCHAFGAGSHVVTAFTRDAMGCLAEASTPVTVMDPAALPEISGPGATPLRVERVGLQLRISFDDTIYETGVYAGSIQGLRPSGYSHDAIGACRLTGGDVLAALPAGDTYYLVVASGCTPFAEGPYGWNSLGALRPSAPDLGYLGCP